MNDENKNVPSNLWPLKKALLVILSSMCVVLCAFGGVFLYFRHIQEKQRHDSAYQIVAIMQSTAGSEELKTVYFAELIGLSIDQPANLYQFKTREAKEKLLACPVIHEASVKKIFPGTVHINYLLRKPIAFLGDYTNAAIDKEGIVFPFKPFYTPKKLPEIYLGEDFSEESDENEHSSEVAWGKRLRGRRIDLAFTVFEYATNHCLDETCSLRSIDVSKAFAPSCGQRQIVLVFEDSAEKVVDGNIVLSIYPRILRLSTENYRQQLANYTVLRNHLRKNESETGLSQGQGPIVNAKATVIDLRLSDLAFINAE